jgi:hypothetical protein
LFISFDTARGDGHGKTNERLWSAGGLQAASMTEGAIRLSAIAGVDHPACKISHIAYLALRRRGEIATIDRRKGKAFNLPNIFHSFPIRRRQQGQH